MKQVENASVKFKLPGKRPQRQIQPGSRRSVGLVNPFMPTLKMVEEWINAQPTVDENIRAELIKMVRQVPA